MQSTSKLQSINPYNQDLVGEFQTFTAAEVDQTIKSANTAFYAWREKPISERVEPLKRLAKLLREKKEACAETISMEMGKPIKEALAEVEKCAWLCDYYAENSEAFLSPKIIKTDATKSFVNYEPLGVIYGIMPWNFPYWQVFRFAVPALMAGNAAVLKHAPNVSQCAIDIEALFAEAGFPLHLFSTIFLTNDFASQVIKHHYVRAVSLTGSEGAGRAVAQAAGAVLKPTLLELGGSNAVIVLKDAELDLAVQTGFNARFLNSGQSCIAGKRFLIAEELYDAYIGKFRVKIEKLKRMNPLDKTCDIGPLARVDLAEKLEQQVKDSIALGAELVIGGKRDGAFYEPTMLKGMTAEMPVFNQELFGPVAPFMPIEDLDHAIELSNQSNFGLGVSICTRNPQQVLDKVHLFDEGAVFINELVKSDPRLPFGGIKNSGYGRELAENGIKAFVNVKTVYVK
jgi:succinate-semialdehyde dehydrogenase / glutarate-semialdehyde dehydrogenase